MSLDDDSATATPGNSAPGTPARPNLPNQQAGRIPPPRRHPLPITPGRLRIFGLAMFLTRLFGALFLVFSTYNPSGWSLWHWYQTGWPAEWTLLLPISVVWLVVYILLWRAAYRALRPSGLALTTALIGSLVWVLVDTGIVPLNVPGDLVIIVLYMSGGVLTAGVTWSSAWATLTGQVITNDLTR